MVTAVTVRSVRLLCLRMLVAGIQEEQHRKSKDDLSDEEELEVLFRAVKTRKDSVQQALEELMAALDSDDDDLLFGDAGETDVGDLTMAFLKGI